MRKLVGLDDLVGKTVESVNQDEDFAFAIHFTDGTSLAVETEEFMHTSKVVIIEDPFESIWTESIGVITADEYAEYSRKKRVEQEKRQEASERAAYEKLKAKFEGTETRKLERLQRDNDVYG